MPKFILKLAAWFVLFLTIIVVLTILFMVFYIFYYIKDANTLKLVLIDGAIIALGVIVFAAGLGVFEILRNYAGMEQRIEELKTNMRYAAEIRQTRRNAPPARYQRTVRPRYR